MSAVFKVNMISLVYQCTIWLATGKSVCAPPLQNNLPTVVEFQESTRYAADPGANSFILGVCM